MSARGKDIKNNIELAHYDFSLFDNSYVATVVIHVELNESGVPYDFTIVYGNEKLANMFSMQVDEIVGKKYYTDLFSDANREWLKEFYKAAYENESIDYSGTSSVMKMQLRIKSSQITYGYCLVYVNEEENSIAMLQEEQWQKIKMLNNAIHSGYWSILYDQDGNWDSITWTDEFRHMLGFNNIVDFPNTLQACLERVHQKDKARILKAYYKVVNDTTNNTEYDVDYRVKTKIGEYRWFRSVGKLICRADGTPKEFAGILFDVNDKYEHEYKDTLTGGYSRKGFIREAESYFDNVNDKTELAVLYFNIKNLKAVNEIFGLEGGDWIIKYFYTQLCESKLEPIVTARLEADHFVCLVKKNKLDYTYLTEKMSQVLNYEGRTIHMFLKCGIYFVEDKTMAVSRMIDRAKLAKKFIIDEYIKPYEVFESSMSKNYLGHAEIRADFENSIAKNEFKVYFQPVVEATTGNLVSAEALVRWIHPKKGIISPGIFINELEKDGYISKLDSYVILSVYECIASRTKAGLPMIPISINLSWMDFNDEVLMSEIIARLKSDLIPDNKIRFEVTETSFAAMVKNYSHLLESLRKHGAKIFLDDFGSGYSSFGMLKNYEFDVLKIDMSFIQKIEENHKVRNIIRAIIDMCHQIGVKVIAEGAETQRQVEFLISNECDYIQGYYFSKPLPEEKFMEYIDMCWEQNRISDSTRAGFTCLRSYFKEGLNYISDEIKKVVIMDNDQIEKALTLNHAVGVVSGLFDERFSIGYISDIALNIVDYTLEELIDKTMGSYLELIAPADREQFLNSLEEPHRTYNLVKKDGSVVRVEDKQVITNALNGKKQWIITIRRTKIVTYS